MNIKILWDFFFKFELFSLRNLGEKTSFIELDTPQMSEDQRVELEELVNESIRNCTSMYPTIYEGADDPELKKVSFWVLLFLKVAFTVSSHELTAPVN